MQASDEQVELLETYLDGELPDGDAVALEARIESEPVLARELASLRAQRAARREVFAALEPDPMSSARLVQSVRRHVNKDRVLGQRLRMLRYVSAAAACVVMGFFVGWFIRDRNHAGVNVPGAGPVIGTVTGVSAGGPVQPRGQFQVTLYDRLGRVVAVQRFDTYPEARQFTEDLAQWQRAQQQMRLAEPTMREQF